MGRFIEGIDVVVIRRVPTGEVDDMGEPVTRDAWEGVRDVLVSPSSTSDMDEPARPHGDKTSVRLHFPKSYTASLAGCDIELDGVLYRVQGDPQGYIPDLTPGRWNRPVTAKKVEG